jgi:alpha-tubulin suppressor-like RCC1 family protein
VCGSNEYEALGISDHRSTSSPVLLESIEEKVVQISANLTWHSMVLTGILEYIQLTLLESGKVYLWGMNGFPEPTLVKDLIDVSIVHISTGGRNSSEFCFALDGISLSQNLTSSIDQGVMYSWGHNHHGQLALGDLLYRESPVRVEFEHKIKDVNCGLDCVMAVTGTL